MSKVNIELGQKSGTLGRDHDDVVQDYHKGYTCEIRMFSSIFQTIATLFKVCTVHLEQCQRLRLSSYGTNGKVLYKYKMLLSSILQEIQPKLKLSKFDIELGQRSRS